MKILQFSENENKMLKRKEIRCTIEYSGTTPKREQVSEILAKKTGIASDMLAIKKIAGSYGKQQVIVEAYGYLDSVMKEKIEVVKKKKKAAAAESK